VAAATPPRRGGNVSTAEFAGIDSGQFQGAVEGDFRAFRGIPFAAHPADARRSVDHWILARNVRVLPVST
jgi:hypothetical protein